MNTATLERAPMENDAPRARRSHAGMAFIAGISAGLAAGLFLKSEKGQELTEDAKQEALRLQKQLMKKLDDVRTLTRERYESIVEDIVDRYAQAKEIAVTELEDLKAYLLEQWDDMRAQWDARREHDEEDKS